MWEKWGGGKPPYPSPVRGSASNLRSTQKVCQSHMKTISFSLQYCGGWLLVNVTCCLLPRHNFCELLKTVEGVYLLLRKLACCFQAFGVAALIYICVNMIYQYDLSIRRCHWHAHRLHVLQRVIVRSNVMPYLCGCIRTYIISDWTRIYLAFVHQFSWFLKYVCAKMSVLIIPKKQNLRCIAAGRLLNSTYKHNELSPRGCECRSIHLSFSFHVLGPERSHKHKHA